MNFLKILLLVIACLGVKTQDARAHALQPGYLELTVLSGDSFRIFWRRPDVQGTAMNIEAVMPANCQARTGPPSRFDGSAWVSLWITNCPGGLAGGTIEISGLDAQQTDVLLRYETVSGAMRSHRLTPDSAFFTVPTNPAAFDVVTTYLPLGVQHILEGLDHLLFVFALLLLIRGKWRLVGAITAFTVAHSITMGVATLGWFDLPGPPVEAVIALSILFVAAELARQRTENERFSERYPWSVSFSFGLLHGFGFAGALSEIGLPQTEIPVALLSFNLGVEIGQLLFVGVILLIGVILRTLLPALKQHIGPGSPTTIVGAYAIGSIAAFWFVERVAGF